MGLGRNLCRVDLPGCRHLSAQESTKRVCGLDDCSVAGYVGHRGKRIKGLSSADGPWNAVHGNDGELPGLELLHQLWILAWLDKANKEATLHHEVGFVLSVSLSWRSDLDWEGTLARKFVRRLVAMLVHLVEKRSQMESLR